jgi:hypothetical protein
MRLSVVVIVLRLAVCYPFNTDDVALVLSVTNVIFLANSCGNAIRTAAMILKFAPIMLMSRTRKMMVMNVRARPTVAN